MSRQFQKRPLSWVKAPDNVRRNLGTEEELIALGNSYKKRPIQLIELVPYELQSIV